MGKFFYYYGNVNPLTGVKGAGLSSNGNPNNLSNGCLYDYDPTDATLLATINAARAASALGSCTTAASGHPKLTALPNTQTITRMCQAITLFNNFIDIISNTDFPVSGAALLQLKTLFSDACTKYASLGDICNVTSQSVCETDYATSPLTDKLQAYFFYIFETLFS